MMTQSTATTDFYLAQSVAHNIVFLCVIYPEFQKVICSGGRHSTNSTGSSRGRPQRSRVFRFCKSNSTSESLIVSTAAGVIFAREGRGNSEWTASQRRGPTTARQLRAIRVANSASVSGGTAQRLTMRRHRSIGGALISAGLNAQLAADVHLSAVGAQKRLGELCLLSFSQLNLREKLLGIQDRNILRRIHTVREYC
jgi:hypothetical protein